MSLEVFEGMDNDACNRLATPSTLPTNRYSINTNMKHKHAVETQTQKRCPPTYSINTAQMDPHAQRTGSAYVLRSICKTPQKFATTVWETDGLQLSSFAFSIHIASFLRDLKDFFDLVIVYIELLQTEPSHRVNRPFPKTPDSPSPCL